MAITIERHLDQLNDMLLRMEGCPEKAEDIKREFLRSIARSESERTVGVIATILSKIYDFDHNALKADLTKVIVFDAERVADENERVAFLQCIAGTIDFYMKGDYSFLLNYIDSLCWDAEDYDCEELPFN